MTIAHVEKFAELVAKDPALLVQLGLEKANADAAAASASMAAFVTNAVIFAKRLGLEFTEEEAKAFMVRAVAAASSGELSDTQLEAVAGGKSLNEDVNLDISRTLAMQYGGVMRQFVMSQAPLTKNDFKRT